MDAIADTTYLIDLWREGGDGPASRFAAANADLAIGLPWVAVGEFLAGAARAGHALEAVRVALAPFPRVQSSDGIIESYAQLEAGLRRAHAWIGSPDAWVAATALTLEVPVLTRNVGDFGRVPGLALLDYVRS